MKARFSLIFLLLVFYSGFGKPSTDLLQYLSSTTLKNSLRNLNHSPMSRTNLPTSNLNNDLIIGATDPDEKVTITGDYFLQGNITIVNRGILNIENADFKFDGDIFIMGQGQMNVSHSKFTVIQEYIYEHEAVVVQSGKLYFSDVQFQSSGQSWGNAFADSAEYILENCEISDGFITTGFLGKATGSISNTQMPGEFLCFGQNDLEIKNSDLLLMWLVLLDSSIVESSLPGDSLVINWNFSSTDPKIENIPYSLKIDSCTNVLWGIISFSGSEAIFRDSEFRTIGLMFQNSDSTYVSNITNESSHSDEMISLSDRTLRLVNSQVHTWSFYPSGGSKLTVENCVFGELLAQDSSEVNIMNSVCDGSGGYLGAMNNSFLFVWGSLIKSQVISRQYSVLVGGESSFWGTRITADESAVMLLANTARMVEPSALHSAIIFEAQCPPVEGMVNDAVPIFGTARLIKGAESLIDFLGYEVYYSENDEQNNWIRINEFYPYAVMNDTLALWNTHGLSMGNYGIKLSLFHSFGEPISIPSWARLDETTLVESTVHTMANEFSLSQNYPNPFNPVTEIHYQLPQACYVTLKVYDIMGRKIHTLMEELLPAGSHSVQWNGKDDAGKSVTSGVYLYRIEAGSFRDSKKMILMR